MSRPGSGRGGMEARCLPPLQCSEHAKGERKAWKATRAAKGHGERTHSRQIEFFKLLCAIFCFKLLSSARREIFVFFSETK
jgi:hypothetical protein